MVSRFFQQDWFLAGHHPTGPATVGRGLFLSLPQGERPATSACPLAWLVRGPDRPNGSRGCTEVSCISTVTPLVGRPSFFVFIVLPTL
jgi:hypothetical protein